MARLDESDFVDLGLASPDLRRRFLGVQALALGQPFDLLPGGEVTEEDVASARAAAAEVAERSAIALALEATLGKAEKLGIISPAQAILSRPSNFADVTPAEAQVSCLVVNQTQT